MAGVFVERAQLGARGMPHSLSGSDPHRKNPFLDQLSQVSTGAPRHATIQIVPPPRRPDRNFPVRPQVCTQKTTVPRKPRVVHLDSLSTSLELILYVRTFRK